MTQLFQPEQKTFIEKRGILLQSLHESLIDTQQQINRIDRKHLQLCMVMKPEEQTEVKLLRSEMRRQQARLESLLVELENPQTSFAPV